MDLVTGASGLLGGNLARSLCHVGRSVRILARSGSKLGHLEAGIEKAAGDLSSLPALEAAMAGIDTVYHCAASVSMLREMTPAIWQTNVVGTENVLAAAAKMGVRRVVHCSSVDALGLPEGAGAVSTEETAWNWDRLGVENAYARSKYEAQQRVLRAARAGLDAVVVCPTFMFGAYDTHPSSGAMILSMARSPVTLGVRGGNNFVDVEDVAAGMMAAAERGRVGEVYILGNANLMYDEIFALITGVLGKKTLRVPLPYAAVRLVGKMGDTLERVRGRETGFNSSVARLGYLFHYYDAGKAVRELDLPQHAVGAAVERAVAWFRQVGMLSE